MPSILCIDDNRSFLQSMVDRLRFAGYKVDSAIDPESAIRLFLASPFRYDIVITDMEFPGYQDGESLVQHLIELRENRGYDVAPAIICITGARSKQEPELINRLRERRCIYVLKGTDQYFLETQAAIARLKESREKGPTLLFTHGAAEKYSWDRHLELKCSEGESIDKVSVLHDGGWETIEIADAPRRVFDLLARHTTRRALSLEEATNAMSLNAFYSYWGSDGTVSSESFKNNVSRIRVALRNSFDKLHISLDENKVLETKTYKDTTEPSSDKSILAQSRIKLADPNAIKPFSKKAEFYAVNARCIVEHLP